MKAGLANAACDIPDCSFLPTTSVLGGTLAVRAHHGRAMLLSYLPSVNSQDREAAGSGRLTRAAILCQLLGGSPS